MNQHEILASSPLLKGDGSLAEPGYAKSLLPVYRRAHIKASPLRIKEWDYYLINNGRFALALTIDDNGYMGLDSVSFMNLDEGWERTVSPMCLLPLGGRRMPESSASGDVAVRGRGYFLRFAHVDEPGRPGARRLTFRMDNFLSSQPILGSVTLFDEPEDSMVIATPFNKPGHFYYNQKINCLRAQGFVTVAGRRYEFRPEEAFAVLDWGRGVWTYRNTWYWGSASYQVDGVPFGWNLGYGFGDVSAASENMLFYGGKAHKLSGVTFNIPRRDDGKLLYMSPWTFTSDDGRFEMDFVPVLDRASRTDIKLICSDQHQVFGRFTGRAVLDGGKVISVRDFPGFAERVENKW